ncbi:hypothetical protein MASR1M45_29640 [Candidatus Kapaibacterium sp.]
MKQKMFTLFTVAILFAATTTDSFAQLTKIWEIKNFSAPLEALSPNAKLGHLGGFLIDLTNGNIIDTKVNPERFHLTYSGDRYFVSNWQEKTMKVYDRYTKEFIQDLEYKLTTDGSITAPDDSTMFVFEPTTHTLNFWNIYKNEFTDSYKIPNTPNEIKYSVGLKPTFSYDGRYFGFTFRLIGGAEEYYFMVYDRVAREIIFFQTIPISQYSFVYSFMHTSNQMAYGEVIKLEGDIKPYSYIRIFDLDKRENVRNVRLFENDSQYASFITLRQDDNIFAHGNGQNNDIQFFDFVKNQKCELILPKFPGPLYLDDSLYITGSMKGYHIDWTTVGIEDTNPTGDYPVLYPNPTTNSINLEISEVYFNGIWEITDLTGTKLLKGIIQPSPNFHLDISNLPSATYYLRLTNGKEIKVEKVVKW